MSEQPNHPKIAQHSSASNEHYTPPEVVEAARETLGVIDLDPASCEIANRVVRARFIYTIDNPGHAQPWFGNVFLNPPGGMVDEHFRAMKKKCKETGECGLAPGHSHVGATSSAKAWWFKLAREWSEGRIEQAIFVAFSLELLQSSQVNAPPGLPIPMDVPMCVPSSRLKFHTDVADDGALIVGEQPTHANVVLYLPRIAHFDADVARFEDAFAQIGRVRR